MVNIASVEKRVRTVRVDLGEGDVLEATYRPAAYTPEFEGKINDALRAGDRDALGSMVVALVTDWELYEDEKQTKKVPLTVERVRTLPMMILGPTLDTIGGDLNPNRKTAVASGGGSMEA